jgi:hypothetical protein
MEKEEAPSDEAPISSMQVRTGAEQDERAEQLLKIFSELEAHEASMSQDQFGELVSQAALACGFKNAAEACESLIGPALSRLQRRVRHVTKTKVPGGRQVMIS